MSLQILSLISDSIKSLKHFVEISIQFYYNNFIDYKSIPECMYVHKVAVLLCIYQWVLKFYFEFDVDIFIYFWEFQCTIYLPLKVLFRRFCFWVVVFCTCLTCGHLKIFQRAFNLKLYCLLCLVTMARTSISRSASSLEVQSQSNFFFSI